MGKLKEICAYIPTVGILVALMTLALPYGSVQRIGLIVAGTGYLVDYIVNRRWQGWRWTREKWVYVVLIAFYLCIPLRELFTPVYNWLFLSKLESYLPFLVVGVMGLMGFNYTLKLEYVAGAMSLACLGLGAVLVHAMVGAQAADFLAWQAQLNEMRILYLNSHMVVNVYCNMTLIFIAWVLLESSCRSWYKWVLACVGIGIITGLVLTEGRTGQLTMMALVPVFVAARFYKRSLRKWMVPALMVALTGVGLLWYYNPRYHTQNPEDNPRIYIWHVGTEMVKERPIAGWGVSAARDEFIRRGQEDSDFMNHYLYEFINASNERFGEVRLWIMHPHNVFLETTMELGAIGLLVFLLCLILPICLLQIGHYRWYLAACLFVFAMQAMFESMGSCLLPIWVPLLTYIWRYNAATRPSSLAQPSQELA